MKKLIILISLLLALPVNASFDHNLYYGMQNNSEVTELQEFLTVEKLYSGPVTGSFYSLTLQGVKSFQEREGITPFSGYFGPKTRGAANSILSEIIGEEGEEVIATTTTQSTLNDLLLSLQGQVSVLMQQLEELKSIKIMQKEQSDKLGEIKKNTDLPVKEEVIVPSTKKEITVDIGPRNLNKDKEPYYSLYVFYLEDGVKKAGTEIVISSDDNGKFITERLLSEELGYQSYVVDKTATQITRFMGYRDNKPLAIFTYVPNATGTRTLTISANGYSTTISILGK
jgi:hypothetical protein